MNRGKIVVLAVSLALGTGLSLPTGAAAWAPAGEAAIHPGVQLFTAGAQCTANFIFEEGSSVYIGQAAHCAGTGEATETNGCTSGSLPLGTPVEISGATQPGTLAYSSWLAMQAKGETDPNACEFNDLALVRIAAADMGRVNPSVPFWGGPSGDGSVEEPGSKVFSYGNSELRAGISQLSPKEGILVANEGGGWSHQVLTATPGIPGDSGSGFMNEAGEAIGVLSTVQIAPLAGSNGVGDIGREIAYMHANSPFGGMQLVPGTQPFNSEPVEDALGPAPTPPSQEGGSPSGGEGGSGREGGSGGGSNSEGKKGSPPVSAPGKRCGKRRQSPSRARLTRRSASAFCSRRTCRTVHRSKGRRACTTSAWRRRRLGSLTL